MKPGFGPSIDGYVDGFIHISSHHIIQKYHGTVQKDVITLASPQASRPSMATKWEKEYDWSKLLGGAR